MSMVSNESGITIASIYDLIDNACREDFGIEEQIKYALLTLFPDIVDCLTMPVINKLKLLISTQIESFDGIKDIVQNITASIQASGKIEIGEIVNVFTSLKANPIEAIQVFTHIVQNTDNIKVTMKHVFKNTFENTSAFSDFVFRFIIFIIIESVIHAVHEYNVYIVNNKNTIKEIINALYLTYKSNTIIHDAFDVFISSSKKHKKAYHAVKSITT